jgi:protein phosphatase
MISYEKTDVGVKRRVNQDSIFSSNTQIGKLPNLYIVADGMGGELAGDYASAKCVEIIVQEIEKSTELEAVRIIEKAIQIANNRIFTEAKNDPTKTGMGTTLVLATVFDGHLYVANVGDSRLYVTTKDSLRQITRDHSVVAELVATGELAASDAKYDKRKNMITRAVGAENTIMADYFDVEINGDEKILLCSDGLTNMVDDNEIYSIITSDDTIANRANKLVSVANANGGKDNVSVIIIE